MLPSIIYPPIINPIYHNDAAATYFMEASRWPNGVVCPFCRSNKYCRQAGISMGPGWYYCSLCTNKFTVRVGTIMERSHIPMSKWALAWHLVGESVSVLKISKLLGITYKSAWGMTNRIYGYMLVQGDTPPPAEDAPKRLRARFIRRINSTSKDPDCARLPEMTELLFDKFYTDLDEQVPETFEPKEPEPEPESKESPYLHPCLQEEVKVKAKVRNCLTCSRMFTSQGAHNRMCAYCRGKTDAGDYGP